MKTTKTTKEEQIEQQIIELFEFVPENGIREAYDAAFEICSQNTRYLQMLYEHLETLFWKSDTKSESSKLYKELRNELKTYVMENCNFEQLKEFFNN